MNTENAVSSEITELPPNEAARWPEGAIVYHIYPRSLQDSTGDGIGDLPGVISRLDYLQDLGVNAIWLSPFYPSPMADFGYDVANYCDVDPMFGTLADFDRLQVEAAARGIKVIIDLVPNHTSDDHEWFKQSAGSRDNPRNDWYIWHDGKLAVDGSRTPPNNWIDVFSGQSAWEWHAGRQQYYLHSFHKRQPDLNWSNPAVRNAIKDVMRFWLDRGVDGFRVDAVYWMGKEPLLSDDAPNPEYVPGEGEAYDALRHNNSRGWPVVYAYLAEMADVLKEPTYADRERFMVTEAYPDRHNTLAAYMSFYVAMDPEVAAPFNFEGLTMPWEATQWRQFLTSFHQALSTFNPYCVASYAFGNHDQTRLASRLGEAAARSAAVMQLTLPGMVFVYYGEELGMPNATIPPQYSQDPAAVGGGSRDPERTPMQWTADPLADFTTGTPWLPIGESVLTHNVMAELADPSSSLNLYKTLMALRNQRPSLKLGTITVLDLTHPTVLGYVRSHEADEAFVVLINFADEPATCPLPELVASASERLVSSLPVPEAVVADGTVQLGAHEAAIFRY